MFLFYGLSMCLAIFGVRWLVSALLDGRTGAAFLMQSQNQSGDRTATLQRLRQDAKQIPGWRL